MNEMDLLSKCLLAGLAFAILIFVLRWGKKD